MFLLSLPRILSVKARIWPLCTSFLQLLVTLLMIRQHKCVLCHQVCMQVLSFRTRLGGKVFLRLPTYALTLGHLFKSVLWFRMPHFWAIKLRYLGFYFWTKWVLRVPPAICAAQQKFRLKWALLEGMQNGCCFWKCWLPFRFSSWKLLQILISLIRR